MPGRILVVDDLATNRIILKAKLSAARYDVVAVGELAEISNLTDAPPDLLILGLGTLDDARKRLKELWKIRELSQLPLLVITRNRDPDLRMMLLRHGAADILEFPLEVGFLFARIRSCLRGAETGKELRLRESTTRALGLAESPASFSRPKFVALVSEDPRGTMALRRRIMDELGAAVTLVPPSGRSPECPQPGWDAIVISETAGSNSTVLNLLPEFRSQPDARHAAIVVQFDSPDAVAGAMALDLGASDVAIATHGMDELVCRLGRQLAAKSDADRLRKTMQTGLEMALTDPLTGLYNRRYALSHLDQVSQNAQQSGQSFAVMLADLDRFKSVNDTYGHQAGDAVLIAVADRLRDNLRAVDLVARVGGEEFLIVMPDTSLKAARAAAERICAMMKSHPVALPDGNGDVSVTLSIGLSVGPGNDTGRKGNEKLIAAADTALYTAKSEGRDKVTVGQSAA